MNRRTWLGAVVASLAAAVFPAPAPAVPRVVTYYTPTLNYRDMRRLGGKRDRDGWTVVRVSAHAIYESGKGLWRVDVTYRPPS